MAEERLAGAQNIWRASNLEEEECWKWPPRNALDSTRDCQ